MSLDLSPRAAAAPRPARLLHHARVEVGLQLRNGEQLLLALVIPVGLLVAGLLWGRPLGVDPVAYPASILALAVWSTSFTSLAITTGFERRYGVLERLIATPLSRADLVIGKALATAAVAAGQVTLLAAVAAGLGWRPAPTASGTLVAVAAALLASGCFAALALALAGRLEATVTLGLVNLIYLAGAAGGGLVLPVAAYPEAARLPVSLLPTAALGESLRSWASGGVEPGALGVLGCWLVLALLVARKAFRWTA
nr:ABC transporter permease [Propionibacterium sp.]